MDEPPAAAEPSDFFAAVPPAAAEPSAFFSVDADELPLAAGELALPDVLALPDALPCFSVLGFCSWLIGGVWPACDSCFFSCATVPNDSIAAATATAMGLNLIEISFSWDPDRWTTYRWTTSEKEQSPCPSRENFGEPR